MQQLSQVLDLTISYFSRQPDIGDVFIGYRDDTAASIILQVFHSQLSDGEPDAYVDENQVRYISSYVLTVK